MNHFGEPYGFWDFFSEVPLLFKLFFGILLVIVVGGFSYVIIKGLRMWVSNNRAEVITQKCKIVDKRTEVSGGSGDSSTSTHYYVTFETEEHRRFELYIPDKVYGLLVVGDEGELTYQGTRFKDFTRTAV